ncbi:MAG: diacylglycerol kinase family protein [Chloroflexota bacterium]
MRQVIVIVNPAAGSGRAVRAASALHAAIDASGAQRVTSAGPGDIERLAREAAQAGAERIVAIGGEGTIQEIANGLHGAAALPVLGIVPGGNGNDLARALGLPRDPFVALALALHAPGLPVDTGWARAGGRERRFVAAGGVGFDAAVAGRMAGRRSWWQRGQAGYLLTTLDELRRHRNARVEVVVDGIRLALNGPILFAAFANGAYYGGGMQICPTARPDDGKLDLCLVGDLSRLEALRQLPGLYRGAHVGHPRVAFHQFRTLRIDGDRAPLHLDGEPFGSLPLEVTVERGALLVARPAGSGTVTA